MGYTLAEKILARASSQAEVKPQQFVTANVDRVMIQDSGTERLYPILEEAGVNRVWDANKVAFFQDHYVPAASVNRAEVLKKERNVVESLGVRNIYGQNVGVSHQVMMEKGWVLPGELIVATDSHTPMYGALGAAGTGIGVSEMAYVLATGTLWFMVPHTIKFVLQGKLQYPVMSKDIILHIAGRYSTSVAQYKAIEFVGPVADQMSIDSRMTMCNMGMEIGAKFAFFKPDEKVKEYLTFRTDEKLNFVTPDDDASYEKIYKVDVSGLEPQVAQPYAVDNVKPISQIEKTKIDQAVLGSCTNGRLEDLRIAAAILKGKKIHNRTRLLVIPASMEIYKAALVEGILGTFIDSGAMICNPGCGPCFGAHMGLLASGETCIASINRNFKGRMGSPESRVFLASPATVAASAIEGQIADPRNHYKG